MSTVSLSQVNVVIVRFASRKGSKVNALEVDGRLTVGPDQVQSTAFLNLVANSKDFTPHRKGNACTWVRNGHTSTKRTPKATVVNRPRYERKQFTETDNAGIYIDQHSNQYMKVGNSYKPLAC